MADRVTLFTHFVCESDHVHRIQQLLKARLEFGMFCFDAVSSFTEEPVNLEHNDVTVIEA